MHLGTPPDMSRLDVLAAAALLGFIVACNPFDPGVSSRRLVVHHHPVECTGAWEQLCLLIKAPGKVEFIRHYAGIEGFEYEWDFVSELEVTDHRILNPPVDGSSIRTILRRVVSKERVPPGTEFEIILTSGEGRLARVAQDRYRMYEQAEFICQLGAACDELQSEVAAGARMLLRLEYPTDTADPLILRGWVTCTTGHFGSSACTS
jgi:hypothetical protein